MKKNFILLLCIISLVAVSMASCQPHEHTFSDNWYSDAENHWHPATCEHAETERSELAAHVDANEDGLCDVCEYEIGHTHTYESAWSSNDTHHWKNPTCTHEEKGEYSTHSDEDINGACDVCGGHVHNVNAAGYCIFADCGEKVKEIDETSLDELVAAILVQKHLVNGGKVDYSFTGKSNAGMSYYACKHDMINYNYGKDNYLHVFVNNYNINEGYNTGIPESAANGKDPFFNENGNWIIGEIDTGVKVSFINTPYLGNNGTWIINGTDTEIPEAAANGNAPYCGSDGKWWIGDTNTGVAVMVGNTPRVGLDKTWVFGGNEATGTLESWYQLVGPENVFGVVSENGGDLKLDLPEVAKLNGYFISMSTLVSEYGVEETLYALYEVAISDVSDELVVIPDTSENKVTFKYNYKTVFVNEHMIAVGDNAGEMVYNVNHFIVEVTFKYNDDFALTDLTMLVDCYTNDPGTADGYGFLYPDVDIEYDPETDEFIFVEYVREGDAWVAYPTEKRTPDTYVINVTQTVGERTEENPNPKSKFTPENFDLYFDIDEDTGALSNKFEGATIEADVRDIIKLYVGDCYPENTSIHFVADQVTFKLYKNGVEVQNVEDYLNETAVAMFTFAGEQRLFFIIPKEDGFYKFEIYLMGELLHTLSMNVGVVDEEFIELEDDEIAVKITETYAWSNEVIFTADEAGRYYFNLPAGIGFINADEYDVAMETPATDDGPEPYFDYNATGNENGGSFYLELEAGESIRLYANGTKRGTVVIKVVLF